jgi:cystathionine beta-lyase
MPLPADDRRRYHVDMDLFSASITPESAAFLLSNPHNPVGRVFTHAELSAMADLCLQHDLTIVSDEIHCDLVFPGAQHIPIAALSPEVARRTVTLMAPSKTFNIAGLHGSFMVATDPDLRARLNTARDELLGAVNALGMVGMLAAYRDGQEWLDQALAYLAANRDLLAGFVRDHFPGVHMTWPEATYLAWLDFRDLNLATTPFKFFLKHAGVALSDGHYFGCCSEGFARLNFGCPRPLLEEALGKMETALRSEGVLAAA